MRQFVGIVGAQAQHVGWNAQIDIPLHAGLAPVLVPLGTLCWRNEKFHFHLLKLTGSENEVSWSDLVTE